MNIRYSEIPAHTTELAQSLNTELSAKWKDLRGIEIVSFGVSSITADPEDEETIKQMQKNAAYKDPTLAAATLVGAQAQAMLSGCRVRPVPPPEATEKYFLPFSQHSFL